MRNTKMVVFALLASGLFLGCASSPTKPKFEGSLREVLVKGSPWIVNWDATGGRGRFNQTFTENADGSLTARSDEAGPSFCLRYPQCVSSWTLDLVPAPA